MERFVKIIQKGTNSSISQKNLIKIEKNDIPNNIKDNSKSNLKTELNDELKNNQVENINSEYFDVNKKHVETHIHYLSKDVHFNKISEFPIESLDKLSLGNVNKKVKKADTTLNIPIMKVNGKTNPFFQPSIGNKPNFAKNDLIFCQMVDGVKPDMPFEALVTKFSYISKSHKALFVYIYPDDAENSTYVSQFRKNNLFSICADNFRNLDEDKFFFISEERDFKISDNKLKQLFSLVKKFNVSYIFASYEGLSGPKANQIELENNVKHLLKYVDIPTILFKEPIYLTIEEKESESSKLNWLFVFDMSDTRCFSILSKFIGLVDVNNDNVHGITFLPPTLKKDDIELNFLNEMKLRKIKKYSYEMLNNIKEPYKAVIELVNNGEVHFNFVVIYNKIKPTSNSGVKSEKFNNNNAHIINNCYTNICIYSGL